MVVAFWLPFLINPDLTQLFLAAWNAFAVSSCNVAICRLALMSIRHLTLVQRERDPCNANRSVHERLRPSGKAAWT